MRHIYWLTGLPCSGKTTIARELARHLYAEVLDGDEIREITGNVDFSLEGRTRHMKAAAHIASLLSKHTDVIVALVSPLRAIREELKQFYPNIYEIYVQCDLAICMKRDVKGMYIKALKNEIKNFTGVHQEYEEPLNPDLIVNTGTCSIEECLKKVLTLHDHAKKALLIGRWQPFHKGHEWLVGEVRKKGCKPLIGIRQTPINRANPYSVEERIKRIREIYGDSVDFIVIPDIAGVYWGRNVGYETCELTPPDKIGEISATQLRRNVL